MANLVFLTRIGKCFSCLLLMIAAQASFAAEPRVLIPGATLELIAKEPEIVTPVGMAFDADGRLLVIESHTHQRPDEYAGPAGDRIRSLFDSNGDGRLDTWETFAEDFQQSMNLLSGEPGEVYLVTRRSIELLIDDNRDGKMDRKQSILRLETKENYPHNALGGIAHDGNGGLLVGMGENFGAAYKLVGSDDSSYSDRGGVGTIFRCTADGKNLRRFCNGFWNPFSICRLPTGQVLTVDNDPDSSPPCRLIHAVESGDYGHRWEYSRAGIHPLQAWNGELPGTLPMVVGTGEAPCAVVAHRGSLWVTSWGDHRLERYELTRRGNSYGAKQTIVVQGDSDFRPTGCVVAPDGSLYFADWVSRSYPVHGSGRIWRLSFTENAEKEDALWPEEMIVNADWPTLANDNDPFLRQEAVLREAPLQRWDELSAQQRLAVAQQKRWQATTVSDAWLRQLLDDRDAANRLYAVRWVADERRQSLRGDVERLLGGEISSQQYYLAVLSALEWLDGEAKLRKNDLSDGLMLRELKNPQRSPKLKAMALRLVSPDNQYLSQQRLQEYLQSDHLPLRLEAVRTLVMQSSTQRFALLSSVAQDTSQTEQLRAEAVAGLAASETSADVLAKLASDENPVISKEAKRVQRLLGQRKSKAEERPAAEELDAWYELLAEPGDAEAGRRLFFSARGARCAICHQHSGRGGKVGPDLTRIHQNNSRNQIIASILQPSREIAPHFQPWILEMESGKTITALRMHKSGDWGAEIYANAAGEIFELQGAAIAFRKASEISIMPSGLEKTVSIEQLRDLVEFVAGGE